MYIYRNQIKNDNGGHINFQLSEIYIYSICQLYFQLKILFGDLAPSEQLCGDSIPGDFVKGVPELPVCELPGLSDDSVELVADGGTTFALNADFCDRSSLGSVGEQFWFRPGTVCPRCGCTGRFG